MRPVLAHRDNLIEFGHNSKIDSGTTRSPPPINIPMQRRGKPKQQHNLDSNNLLFSWISIKRDINCHNRSYVDENEIKQQGGDDANESMAAVHTTHPRGNPKLRRRPCLASLFALLCGQPKGGKQTDRCEKDSYVARTKIERRGRNVLMMCKSGKVKNKLCE